MRVPRADAWGAELAKLFPVVKKIGRGSLAVAAFDHDGLGAHRDDAPCRLFKIFQRWRRIPVNFSASGTFSVTTVASGISLVLSAAIASLLNRRSPDFD